MFSHKGTKKINLIANTDLSPYCDKTDSEVEWYETMKSNKMKYKNQSRKLSIENDSVMIPYFENFNETSNNFELGAIIDKRQKCSKRLVFPCKRFFDEEIKLPSHFSFGFNFTQDFGLFKREDYDLIEYKQEKPELKVNKTGTMTDDIASDSEKKRSNAETKQFSSVCNHSSDQLSVDSYGSGCAKLKYGNALFFENIQGKSFYKYQSLHSLHKLLRKHFKCQDLNDKDVQLSTNELVILKSIIARKYKNKVNLNIKSPFLKDKLNQIASLNSNKRVEESYKFVFKRCIRYMKNQFKAIKTYNKKYLIFQNNFNSYFPYFIECNWDILEFICLKNAEDLTLNSMVHMYPKNLNIAQFKNYLRLL